MEKLIPFDKDVSDFRVNVDWNVTATDLNLSFILLGPLSKIIIPRKATQAKRVEGLHNHTCFEVFIKGREKYMEWNFSPSGDWCVYVFHSYRNKATENLGIDEKLFKIELVSQTEDVLKVSVAIRLAALTWLGTQSRQMGVSTVLEHKEDRFSYWALTHARTKPDFHEAKSFTLKF